MWSELQREKIAIIVIKKSHLPKKHCKICGRGYRDQKSLEKHVNNLTLQQHEENEAEVDVAMRETEGDLERFPIVRDDEEQILLHYVSNDEHQSEADLGLMHGVVDVEHQTGLIIELMHVGEDESQTEADVGLMHILGDDREQAMDEQTSIITGEEVSAETFLVLTDLL